MKSCAGTSGIASEPSQIAKSETSGPSSSSSTMNPPPSAVTALRASSSSASRSADVDSLPGREAVRLHHTGRPGDCKLRRRRHSGGRQHVLGEGLGAFDRRRGRARPEDRDARRTQHVGDSADERRLRPDHHEVDVERMREREQPLRVLGANRMALGEPRDARASRGGMEIGQGRGLRELPGKRMLTPARTDQERTHRTSLGASSACASTRRLPTMDHTDFQQWLDAYVEAWRTYDEAAIGELFSEDARYRYHPWDEGDEASRDAPRSSPSWLADRDEPGSLDGRVPPVGDRRRPCRRSRRLALLRGRRRDGRARVPQRLPLPLRRRRAAAPSSRSSSCGATRSSQAKREHALPRRRPSPPA